MSGLSNILAGPLGSAAAILGMAVATYLCRASGVVLMSRVSITPRIHRALRALPGSIVLSAILPLAVDGGAPAVVDSWTISEPVPMEALIQRADRRGPRPGRGSRRTGVAHAALGPAPCGRWRREVGDYPRRR